MMARILSGKEFAARIKEDAARGVAEMKAAGVLPRLAVIIVGSDPASEVYVRNKQRTCEELGIRSDHIALPAETTKEELLACIEELNVDPEVHGILVQLPLPAQIAEDEEEILSHIDPRKDVDGFHPVNVGHLVLGAPGLRPCTPAGCIRMLDYAGIPIEGAHAVIIGRSNIVGKPMAHLLLERNATVTICHSRTQNLAAIARTADILVAAVGRPRFVTADMVKEGATVIDVGINRIAPKKLVGDVDFDAAAAVAGAITPVPGGVGLLTVAMLMENVVQAAKAQNA
jgi:bifunctional protein folD